MPMGCAELWERLDDDDVLVLDCRDADSWDRLAVHIPGALHVELDELTSCARQLPEDELIVVCGCRRDGADARHALRALRVQGRMAVGLDGGLEAWVAGGFPIESHAAFPG